MKVSVVNRITIIILLLCGLCLSPVVAQQTNVKVTISNKSFPERRGTGESVRISSISFSVNEGYIGALASALSNDGNIILEGEVQCPANTLNLKIYVTYIHHTWYIIDRSYTMTKSYDIALELDGYGNTPVVTFNTFTDLVMVVDWSFSVQAEITPFEPVINDIPSVQCYNTPSNLSLTLPNPGRFDFNNVIYEWQCGLYTTEWVANPEFNSFLNRIAYRMSDYCYSSGGYISCEMITTAIQNTNYSSLQDDYDLYSANPQNRYAIASLMLNLIVSQNSSNLPFDEMNFLSSNFYIVSLQEAVFEPPYLLLNIVKDWRSMGTSTNGSKGFDPVEYIDQGISSKTKIGFRVRAYNDTRSGPFSEIRTIDVKPRAPSFNVDATSSCPNRKSAVIQFSSVAGNIPGMSFRFIISEPGQPGDYGFFPGSSYQTEKEYEAGDYVVSVDYDDALLGGCSVDKPINIKALNDLSYTLSKTNATCPGKPDGSIKAEILTKSGEHQFKLASSVSGEAVTYFNNLGTGTYTIEVTDGCHIVPETNTVPISEPPPVSITSVSKADPTCLSIPNGSITITAQGGGGNFDYKVLNSANSVVSSATGQGSSWTFGNMPGGTYMIQARSGGCEWKSSSQNLTQVQPIDFNVNVKNVDCFGQSTGSITVNPSGGQSPYKYSIDSQPYVSGSSFTSLSANTYLVSVHTSNSSCNDIKTSLVTVTSAPKIEIGMSPLNASCFEKNDGLITASVTGGTGPFSFSWEEYSNGSWFPKTGTSGTLESLYAGSYKVNVRDSKNCIESKTTVLTEPSELTVESATPADAVCFGEKGSVELKATGGSGANTYLCYNDVGNIYQSSFTRVSVPPGQYHFKVRDKNGCEADYPDDLVSVTGPEAPLVFNTVLKDYNGYNVSCNGEKNGEVRVEATGGNGYGYEGYVYSLSGSVSQQVNTFNALSAGSYSVKVSDGRGCSVQKTIQLIEPEPLNIQLVHLEPVKCFGESTGEIYVSASGGIVNTYSYRLDDGFIESSDVFRNLSAGIYNIEVADNNGCKEKISAEIQSLHPPILASIAVQDVKCYGENSGVLTASVSGGSGNFIYEWQYKDEGNWQLYNGSGNILSGLSRGEYRIKVADSENCSLYKNALVNEPAPLLINNVISKDVVCYGEKGRIAIEAQGGAGNYQYFFNREDGIKFQSTVSEYDLPVGIYSISIKDANACEKNYPGKAAITSPETALGFTTVTSSFSGYSVSCSGKEDGWVEFNASGGNGFGYTGYTYALAGSSGPTNKFEGLKAGTYSIMVTDGRGCVIQKSLVLNEPDPLQLSLLYSEPVKCYGESTGELAVIASGGIAGTYSYRLDGLEMISPGLFTNLKAQTYVVEVSDVNGCKTNLYAAVDNKNPPLAASLSAISANCYGGNSGSIQTVINGGAGGFSYKWEKKTDSDWQQYQSNSKDPLNLLAGYYRLMVEDSDNCTTSSIVQVTQPDPVGIAAITKRDAICYDDQGSILIEASGGSPAYKYYCSPENSSFTEYFPGSSLSPGSYKIKVADSKGCTFENTGEVIINRPDTPLGLTLELKDYSGYNVSCHGKNDGEITVHPYGGNGDNYSGYSFGLSNTLLQEENVFSGLESGNYEMKLIDGRGCSVTKAITLIEPPSDIALNASDIRMPVCKYDSNGMVILEARGGTGPYLYNIDGREFTSSNEFNDLANGAYSFRVKDVNGCGETFSATLRNSVSEMQVSAIISDSRCYGQNSGSIEVSVTGGAKPYGYTWKNNPSITSHAGNLYKGSYTVNVSDSAGCKAEQTFTVSEPERPVMLTALSSAACVSQKNGSLKATASGGTPPYRYAVDELKNMNSTGFFDVYAGRHTVFVLDINNCPAEIRADVTERNSMPDINFMLATSRYEADTLVVIDVSEPVPDRVIWQFSPDAILIDSSSFQAKVKYAHSGVYPVTMTGVFGSCSYTIDKLLDIAPFDPLVPNAGDHFHGIKTIKISPNPNDSHFELKIELYKKQRLNIKIFDYYSRLIFSDILAPDIYFSRDITLSDALPGTYVLWVIAEDDAKPVLLIISQ
jgi:hypothetical protein